MDATQYLAVFIREAGEHLNNLNDCVAALEKKPGSKRILDEMYRTIHSLHGMTGTMGFERMQHLSRSMENLCAKAQTDGMKVTGRMMDVLSECLDALDKHLKYVKRTAGEGAEENEALIQALEEVVCETQEREVLESLPAVKETKPEAIAQEAEKKKSERPQPVTGNAEEKRPATARTVHVNLEKLDDLMNRVGELIMIKNRFASIRSQEPDGFWGQTFDEDIDYLESVAAGLHASVMQIRMVTMESIVNKFPHMIREFARTSGKRMDLYMSGGDTELDRTVADQIGLPLKHLLRNAAEWGIESREERWQKGKHEKGAIYLNAYREDGNIMIRIRDDGHGIGVEEIREKAVLFDILTQERAESISEGEAWELLFKPEFSMAGSMEERACRGRGLLAARSAIEALGGDMELSSEPEKWFEVLIRIPLSLAIIQAVLIGIGKENYAVALGSILSIEDIPVHEISYHEENCKIFIRGMEVPLIPLDRLLDIKPLKEEKKTYKVIVIKKGGKYAGLVADRLIGQQEIVIKSLGNFIKSDKRISGATILGNGEMALILDVNALM